jgi:hypothetical protein
MECKDLPVIGTIVLECPEHPAATLEGAACSLLVYLGSVAGRSFGTMIILFGG